MHTSLFYTGSFEAARERRLICQHGAPDVPSLPNAMPLGPGGYRERADQNMERARPVQQNAGRSPGIQRMAYENAVRNSEQAARNTYQTGVAYRLGSGAGPGGEGMSEGFRRAQTLPQSRSQMSMNTLQSWGDPMGGMHDFSSDTEAAVRGFSMGPGPRRAPPRGFQQMQAGLYGQRMAPQAGGFPMMQQGNRFNVGTMSPQQLNAQMGNYLQMYGNNLPPDVGNQLLSARPEFQRDMVRLLQVIEGPDGQILTRVIGRLVGPGNVEVLYREMPRITEAITAMARQPQALQQYLANRAPEALDALMVNISPQAQTYARNILPSLSPIELAAFGRLMSHVQALDRTAAANRESYVPQGQEKQRYANLNTLPPRGILRPTPAPIIAPPVTGRQVLPENPEAMSLAWQQEAFVRLVNMAPGLSQAQLKELNAQFATLPPQTRAMLVRVAQSVNPIDGHAIASSLLRIAGNDAVRVPEMGGALIESMTPAALPSLLRYLSARTPANLQAAIAVSPAEHRDFMSQFLAGLTAPEADALARVGRNLGGVALPPLSSPPPAPLPVPTPAPRPDVPEPVADAPSAAVLRQIDEFNRFARAPATVARRFEGGQVILRIIAKPGRGEFVGKVIEATVPVVARRNVPDAPTPTVDFVTADEAQITRLLGILAPAMAMGSPEPAREVGRVSPIGNPDAAANTWIQRTMKRAQDAHGSWLDDLSSYIRPTERKTLAGYANNAAQGGIRFEHPADVRGLYKFVIGAPAPVALHGTWDIVSPLHDEGDLVLVKQGDIGTQKDFQVSAVFGTGGTITFNQVQSIALEAINRRASRNRDEAGIANFDLPRDRPIGAIGLYDANHSWETQQLRSYPQALRASGYNMVGIENNYARAVNQDPVAMMRSQIAAMHAATPPVRDFYVMLVPHGNANGMSFSLTTGTPPRTQRFPLTPQNLLSLCQEYPDSRFTFDINSCISGGMAQVDLQTAFRDLYSGVGGEAGRITVFTQATDISNPVRSPMDPRTLQNGPNTPGDKTSLYNALLLRNLQGTPAGSGNVPPAIARMTYGQAHLAARDEVNRLTPGFMPRARRSGRTGGTETARTPITDLPSGDGRA